MNANYEAVITVPVRGPEGQTRRVEAVVDTGFNRFLILPPALVTELGLPFVTSSPVILADGSEESFDVHDVSVIWDGQPRDVYAYVADATPLVGMSLLDMHDLSIQVRDGGRVVIQPMA
ncbi:MAG: clan AA aspartic protease [Chloroflexota bacterium]|nr:clan AA aspartic protease [Chloroflexota bacterium]